jgi:hypothetical protein
MARSRRRRGSRKGSSGNQHLLHPAAFLSSALAGPTSVSNVAFGIIQTRPARPRSLEIEFMSTIARSFNFTIIAGNGEEIYRSPTILSGPIPRKRMFRLPTSTDFALYTGAENIMLFQHATNPIIHFVCNLVVEYKTSPANAFF